MTSKILINAIDPEECRIAKITNSKLEDFHIESATKEITRSNIYKGVISRVEPSLQAVFIDYGADRHGFLQIQEIHSDYFMENRTGDSSIKNFLKKGQELLVQVIKDPYMRKGAMLTTFISLPGRYIVLMPGSKNNGISRKIEGETERKRLKEILSKLKIPEGYGVIVRTAGANSTKSMLTKDLRYLMRIWKSIKSKAVKEEAPTLLYKERNLAIRAIRDNFTIDVTQILVDDKTVFNEIKEFVNVVAPKHAGIVKIYKGLKPIFSHHQVEQQIATIFENSVRLKSGGSIVIEQTEALVSIDVNSGRATKKSSIEATALQTNMEAAEEVMRQLRLRDLGGLIVIDFIDMRESKNRTKIAKAAKEFAKEDKARTTIGRISKFGLLEMSRQRIRPSIQFGSYEVCSRCAGKGMVPSSESIGLGFIRRLTLDTLKGDISTVKCTVPVNVADYLLNRKRREILDLEARRGITIKILGDPDMKPNEGGIVCEQ